MRVSAAGGAEARAQLATGPRDGTTDWHIVRAHPLQGRPGYILWTVEDITDRHEMEQVIRYEQRKLFDFFENVPVGFYSVDAEGHFLFVNSTFAEWLGRTAEDLTGSGVVLRDIVAEDLPADTPAYDPFGHSGEVLHGRVMQNGADERRFEADISQTTVGGENGAGLWTRSVERDLSREKEMARALEVSEQRFRKFFESAPVGIALLDLTGVVVEANYVFDRTMGQPKGESLDGRRLVDSIDEADRADFTTKLECVAGGAAFAPPIEVRVGEGGEIVVTFYVSAVGEGDGTISGFILHALDSTEQKSLEVQFAHSQKMQAVGQLAGGIAHDFNNLLTAMIGFCDLLLLRFQPGEQSFADIMQIKQNANRATNLVRQLLAFSRQQTLQPKRVDVTDALAELSYLLRRLIGENIELKMIHGRDLGRIRGDQGQLEQVIINLAVNARDAMADGGTLTIRTRNVAGAEADRYGHELLTSGDYVLIEVIDSGEGSTRSISVESSSRSSQPRKWAREPASRRSMASSNRAVASSSSTAPLARARGSTSSCPAIVRPRASPSSRFAVPKRSPSI
jgi:two-component system cell cycle sensor histidine kinase/response regulator CckA